MKQLQLWLWFRVANVVSQQGTFTGLSGRKKYVTIKLDFLVIVNAF